MYKIVFLTFILYSQINCDYLYPPQMPMSDMKTLHKLSLTDNDYYQADAPYTEPSPTDTDDDNADGKDSKKPHQEPPASHDTYLPQDPVHEYVNSYGGPYMPQAPTYGGYQHDYLAAPWMTYGPPPPPMIPMAYAPIQTTYEGYIVPTEPSATHELKSILNILRDILPLPRGFVNVFAKASVLLISLMGVVVFGGAITTAICSFTPLCTISFAALPFLGLRNNPGTKSEEVLPTAIVTADRVRRAAELFNTAIEKFDQMQKQSNLAKRN